MIPVMMRRKRGGGGCQSHIEPISPKKPAMYSGIQLLHPTPVLLQHATCAVSSSVSSFS